MYQNYIATFLNNSFLIYCTVSIKQKANIILIIQYNNYISHIPHKLAYGSSSFGTDWHS